MVTITKNGKKYVLVPLSQWSATRRAKSTDNRSRSQLPEYPPADTEGNRDALAYARVSIARSLIQERLAAGLSQAELARRARMDRSTLNRIERAKVTLDEGTYRRLTAAMKRVR